MRIADICFTVVVTLTMFGATHADETLPYEQKKDVVYAEAHGTGLLMDVFTPTGKPNGLGIVDIASGAWYSDRNKIRDHTLAQVYTIFCSRGYVVFAVRPGSKTRYTAAEMDRNVKSAIRFVKAHAGEYKIDPARLGLTGGSAGGHLATFGRPDAGAGEGQRHEPDRPARHLRPGCGCVLPADRLPRLGRQQAHPDRRPWPAPVRWGRAGTLRERDQRSGQGHLAAAPCR